MNVNEILVELSKKVEKPKGTLTRMYNQIKREKEEAGLTTNLVDDEDVIDRIVLTAICSKYDLGLDTLDNIIDSNEKINKVLGEESVSVEELLDKELADMDEELAETTKETDWRTELEPDTSWAHRFKTAKKSNKSAESFDGEYERVPSLTVIDRVTYRLKLIDPEEEPYEHNGVNRWGKEYTSFKMNIKLLGLSDETLYNEVYEYGDKKGELLFKKGSKYAFWLDKERGFPEFANLWLELGLGVPDNRPFYFKRFKKTSKKGNKYNLFKFSPVPF